MDQFSAVILAAGRGTRMRSSIPKVLHPILGIPMLDHVSRQVCAAGSDDITVVVGHGADQIRKHLKGSDVRTALQDPQRGTGHALLEALDQAAPRYSAWQFFPASQARQKVTVITPSSSAFGGRSRRKRGPGSGQGWSV